MSSSLFDLISLAGSPSLDELRARSSVDDTTLANTVATMVVSGTVALSVKPEFSADPLVQGLIHTLEDSSSGEFKDAVAADRNALTKAIISVLQNEHVATSVTASPTSKGFKRSLSAATKT